MKSMFRLIGVLLAAVVTGKAHAQLSGSYTIGGVTPDYATVNDAVNDLTAQGVQAPCVFYIRPGIYSALLTYPQLNYSFEVEFRSETGNPADVQLTMSNLYQCRNITFSNMTIIPRRNTGYQYNYKGLEIAGSSYIRYDSCVFRGTSDPLERWGPTMISEWGEIYFTYCSFRNLDKGIFISSNSYYQGSYRHYGAHVVSHCDFDSCQTALLVEGEFHGVDDSLLFIENSIINCDIGIKMDGNNEEVRNVKFIRNKIICNNMGVHAYHNTLNGTYRMPLFINNMITAPTCVWSQQNACIGFYNNSFYGQIGFSWTSSNFWFYNNTVQYMGPYVVLAIDDGNTWYAGNNNYYSPNSTGGMFYVGNGSPSSVPDLGTFQSVTGADTASLSVDPMYNDTNDLHSYSPYLKFHGRPYTFISNDIDGESRNPLPDIGADEYHASPLPPHAFFEIACNTSGNYSATLPDTSVRAVSFAWDFGDAGTSSLESPSHTWAGPGPYTITQIVNNPYGSDTSTRLMQFPAVQPVVSINGSLMSVTNGPYVAYQWYYNGSPIANATASSFNAPFNGNYTVMVWDSTCTCPYESAPIAVGIEENEMAQVMISPNPVVDHLNVFVPNPATACFQYEIYDATGQMVVHFANSNKQNSIDLSALSQGLYMLKVMNPETQESVSRQIIKL